MKDSDVNLIVVSDDFEGKDWFERVSLLQSYWKYSIPLEVLPYTGKEFKRKRKSSIVVREALKHGKRVV